MGAARPPEPCARQPVSRSTARCPGGHRAWRRTGRRGTARAGAREDLRDGRARLDLKNAARRRREPVHLTHHELDVLRRVALGMGTAQIAAQLVVSPSTVRKHLENAFGRLGVSSRTAAVARVFPEPEAL
ncbi:helix-turn-helix transcriptional regulator [Streptomyces canus]|uniref:response regulator transcription factor n=1 Tax=Streptomyces canus TaxID=58343 RepID=UPI0033BF9224